MADKQSSNHDEAPCGKPQGFLAKEDGNEIIDRLLAGDQVAWRTLVARYTGFLLGVCRKTFAGYGFEATRQDHEDVVAEVWKNTLENDRRVLHKCRERENLLQTFCLMTRRRAIDWIRAHRNRFLPLTENDAPQKPADVPILDADISALKDALNALNSKEKTLLQLFFLKKKKYREIAMLTGIPQNSIGPTIGRALAKLRSQISAKGAPS